MNFGMHYHDGYYDNPVGFFREVLNIEPTPSQAEALRAFPDSRKLVVRGGRGSGKTLLCAGVAIWGACVRGEKVILPSQKEAYKSLLSDKIIRMCQESTLSWKYEVANRTVSFDSYSPGSITVTPISSCCSFSGHQISNTTVIVDEAAKIRECDYKNVIDGVIGAKLMLVSTPDFIKPEDPELLKIGKKVNQERFFNAFHGIAPGYKALSLDAEFKEGVDSAHLSGPEYEREIHGSFVHLPDKYLDEYFKATKPELPDDFGVPRNDLEKFFVDYFNSCAGPLLGGHFLEYLRGKTPKTGKN